MIGAWPTRPSGLERRVIRADELAEAMVDVVVLGAGKSRSLVLENRDIRAMVSLPSVSR